jgi:hypothetical protein
MIGHYVHHGADHLHRALAVAQAMDEPSVRAGQQP